MKIAKVSVQPSLLISPNEAINIKLTKADNKAIVSPNVMVVIASDSGINKDIKTVAKG